MTKAWHGVEMQESVSRRLWRCVQQTPPRSLLGSQHLPPSSLMPALPFGGAPPLGRHSADLQVLVSGDVVLELMGFEEVFQLLHVALMQPVHLLLGRMWCLLHFDGLPHPGGDGPAVGHKTKAVLEDSTTIEEWDGDSYSLLKSVLEPAHPGARGVLNLLEYVILPKGEDRYQSCPRGDRRE